MHLERLGMIARFMQRFHPTPLAIVKAELKDAELAALQSQSESEYAALRVQIHNLTANYHQGRIERLNKFVVDHNKEKELDSISR